MREWKLWDWIAYACLFIAAIVLAAKELEKYPVMHWLSNPIWSVAPLILVVIATIILLARAFGLISGDKKLEKISNVMYHNQVVEIDGKFFSHCTFDVVTFRYFGGKFQFHDVTITGHRKLEVKALPAHGTIELLKICGFFFEGNIAEFKRKIQIYHESRKEITVSIFNFLIFAVLYWTAPTEKNPGYATGYFYNILQQSL